MKKFLAAVLFTICASQAHAYQRAVPATVCQVVPMNIIQTPNGPQRDVLNIRDRPDGRILDYISELNDVVILNSVGSWSYVYVPSLMGDFMVGNGWVFNRYLNKCHKDFVTE